MGLQPVVKPRLGVRGKTGRRRLIGRRIRAEIAAGKRRGQRLPVKHIVPLGRGHVTRLVGGVNVLDREVVEGAGG